jgi:hypothetical protein
VVLSACEDAGTVSSSNACPDDTGESKRKQKL